MKAETEEKKADRSPAVIELERQLAEEEAAIAALDVGGEERELRDRVEAKKQERLEKELIKKFEAELGRYGRAFSKVESSTGPIFFARKEAVRFKAFQNEKKVDDAAIDRFIKPCIVYPEREEFEAILDRERGLAVTIASRLAYLYGFRKEDIEGKS